MERNMRNAIPGQDGIETEMSEGLQLTNVASKRDQTLETTTNLMEEIVKPNNMNKAYVRVTNNRGAAGIDEMQVSALKTWLQENGKCLVEQLLQGTYQPQPVRRVAIPKSNGGTRQLGIPTVVDRLVQQAFLQVLTAIIDPSFSESSYGFRPNRSAHQALTKAKEYVMSGKGIVVDLDIEKFFDNVNHDILMSMLAKRIGDKRVLKIIRKFLQAGIMANGVCILPEKGTPQGGPLSPLLANIMLDPLDKEIERRGHSFCRYADDCNIYVSTPKAGERVMTSIAEFIEKRLKLKINREKSSVSPSSHPIIPGIPASELWTTNNSSEKHRPHQGENQTDNAKKQRA
jgi:RNA-directed DNA polymerase